MGRNDVNDGVCLIRREVIGARDLFFHLDTLVSK